MLIAIFGLYAARMCAWVENVTYLSGFGDTKGVEHQMRVGINEKGDYVRGAGNYD